jgi:hypothetical protein
LQPLQMNSGIAVAAVLRQAPASHDGPSEDQISHTAGSNSSLQPDN